MSIITGPSSPCIGVCKLDTSENGDEYCTGCFRQLDEIINWPSMSTDQKHQVLARVADTEAKVKSAEKNDKKPE